MSKDGSRPLSSFLNLRPGPGTRSFHHQWRSPGGPPLGLQAEEEENMEGIAETIGETYIKFDLLLKNICAFRECSHLIFANFGINSVK